MSQHLSPEILKRFLHDQLSGVESVSVLLHLERCAECSQLILQPHSDEVMAIFLVEKDAEDA